MIADDSVGASAQRVKAVPPSLAELEKVTGMSRREIRIIYQHFKGAFPAGVIDQADFVKAMGLVFLHGDFFPKISNVSQESRWIL